MSPELVHARWVLQHLTRDEEGTLVVAAGSDLAIVAYLEGQEDPSEAIDQILRLAHGAFTEGGAVELARQLVAVVLQCPAGRALLGQTEAGQSWARFAERPKTQMSAPDEPPPKGALKVGGLGIKIRA